MKGQAHDAAIPTQPATSADPRRAAEEEALDRLETGVSILLRVGALASLAIVIAGSVVMLVQHPDFLTDPASLAPILAPHSTTRTVGGVLKGLASGRGEAIILLGLMLLIGTPVLRVALSVATFLRSRDRLFAGLTATVLCLLLLSFLLGKAG